MILMGITGNTYRETNQQAFKIVGEFSLQDDANISKNFTFKGQRDISTDCWHLDRYSVMEQNAKVPLFKLLPKNIFNQTISIVEKLLTEKVKAKYILDCSLEVGNGKIGSFMQSVGEDVEIKGNLTIKNKGKLKLVRSNIEVTKEFRDKDD